MFPQAGGGGLRFALFGVPITVHPTFIVLALVAGSATGDASDLLVGAVVVFLAILGHELGHAVAAQAYGMPHPEVVIHGFGGHTHVPAGGGRWRRLSMAAAGPLAGFAIGLVALGAGQGLDGEAGRVADWAWSVSWFWSLANLAPILPLDGGRVLVELLPGTELGRLRAARAISVGTGAAAAVVAWTFHEPFITVFGAWFAASNAIDLRRDGWRAPRPSGRRRVDSELHEAFQQLHPGNAPTAEALAWRALSSAAAGQRAFPASALLAALLVQGRHEEAVDVLGTLDHRDVDPYLRAIAELGPTGSAELDRRLASPSAAASDLDAALLARAFDRRWDDVAALAEGDTAGRIQKGWLGLVTSWAFHGGEYDASARLGLAMERRDAAATTPYNVACAYARVGRLDDAVAALHRATERGWAERRTLERDDDLAALHTHPGWAEVLDRATANQRRPTRERGEPFTMPAPAASAFLACAAAMLLLVKVLPSEPDLQDRLGAFDVEDVYDLDDLADVAGFGEGVVAVDATTGDDLWETDEAGVVVDADVDLVLTVLYDLDGGEADEVVELIALDADDGSERWRQPDLELVGIRDDGVLAYDAADDHVAMLDPTDGTTRWRAPGSALDTADDGLVLVGRQDLTTAALDPADGTERWVLDGLPAPATAAGFAGPAGRLVLLIDAGPEDSEVVAVDVDSGDERWRAPGNDVLTASSTHAYLSDPAREVTRVDLTTGASVAVPDAGLPYYGVSGAGVSVLGGDERVVAVDDTAGEVLWEEPSRGDFALAGDGLLMSGVDGIRLLDLRTGAARWTDDERSYFLSVDLESGLVLVARDLATAALDLTDGRERWQSESRSNVGNGIVGNRVFLSR